MGVKMWGANGAEADLVVDVEEVVVLVEKNDRVNGKDGRGLWVDGILSCKVENHEDEEEDKEWSGGVGLRS